VAPYSLRRARQLVTGVAGLRAGTLLRRPDRVIARTRRDVANLKSSTVRRGACESEDKSLLNNGKRSSKRPGPGTGAVKQRGGLTAATETRGQFDLTMPAPATPLLRRVCSGDA
jgi:hypothetical protein